MVKSLHRENIDTLIKIKKYESVDSVTGPPDHSWQNNPEKILKHDIDKTKGYG